MQWHYTKHGDKFGPVDYSELCRLAQQGHITPEDLVWNPDQGDEWALASSIENLFATPPPIVEQSLPVVVDSQPNQGYSKAGVTHNRDLMIMARESLRTHWGLGIGAMLLYQVIIQSISAIPFLGMIAIIVISGPMTIGLYLIFISLARRTKAGIDQLFSGFNRFGTALAAYLLTSLYVLLWCLLLIIPGIIAAYSYSMTFFIIADDPSVTASDAIAQSKEMMQGNKWKMFCLVWRFFGWMLLCILTLGIGFLWLGPYMQMTMAHFYEDVRQQG